MQLLTRATLLILVHNYMCPNCSGGRLSLFNTSMGKYVFHFCRLGGGGFLILIVLFSVGERKKNKNRFHLETAQEKKKNG